MKRALLIAIVLVACKKADPGSDVDAAAAGDAPEQVTDVGADITADTTWTGLIRINTNITIAAGVTVTVMPASRIRIASGVIVDGTLAINGTKTGPVVIESTSSAYWDAFVSSKGTINMTYVNQTLGGFLISGTAHLTVRDSTFSHVTHDLLVVSGGVIDMQYSSIGVPEGHTDTTHCDMHLEGGTPLITVSHSNISTSAYGMMFYSGVGADFTYDNWFSNSIDISRSPPATGDVSHGYFKAGNPNMTGITAQNMATAVIPDSGPR
jgi:hypothetical protein